MPLKFIPEMTNSCRNGPSCCITQRTNCISFYLSLNIPQQVDITDLAFSIFNILQDLFHPTGALAARRTLATAFMTIEPCQRKRITYYTLVFIQYNKPAGAH